MIVAYLRISSGSFQRSLHHCTRVANIEREGRVPSATRVLRTEIRPFAIVVECAWVLRIDQLSILLLYQLLHHTSTGSPPISRVTPQSKVIPFEGLFTMPISFFQPSIVPMICWDPRLIGAGGSFGCNARRTPAFSASGITAFRK